MKNEPNLFAERLKSLCENDCKCIAKFPELTSADFVEFFYQNESDHHALCKFGLTSGKILKQISRGNIYFLDPPLTSPYGEIPLVQVRIFDETRTGYIGALYFNVKDFDAFHAKYKATRGMRFFDFPDCKTAEYRTKSTLIYILDRPECAIHKERIATIDLPLVPDTSSFPPLKPPNPDLPKVDPILFEF